MSNITIGADPEFFLMHTKSGKFVSAHDIVPGTKAKPHRLSKGAVQADGTAVEFNIDPANNEEEFIKNIKTTLGEIRDMIDPSLEFKYQPCVYYPIEYFNSLPYVARELGCDPDYSAFTGRPNVMSTYVNDKVMMRTGAGHIHIGWDKDIPVDDPVHLEDCRLLASALNMPNMIIKRITPANERHLLYGGTNAFRPKPYGMEYREPSNYWLNKEEWWSLVYNLFYECTDNSMKGEYSRYITTVESFYYGCNRDPYLYNYSFKTFSRDVSYAKAIRYSA